MSVPTLNSTNLWNTNKYNNAGYCSDGFKLYISDNGTNVSPYTRYLREVDILAGVESRAVAIPYYSADGKIEQYFLLSQPTVDEKYIYVSCGTQISIISKDTFAIVKTLSIIDLGQTNPIGQYLENIDPIIGSNDSIIVISLYSSSTTTGTNPVTTINNRISIVDKTSLLITGTIDLTSLTFASLNGSTSFIPEKIMLDASSIYSICGGYNVINTDTLNDYRRLVKFSINNLGTFNEFSLKDISGMPSKFLPNNIVQDASNVYIGSTTSSNVLSIQKDSIGTASLIATFLQGGN